MKPDTTRILEQLTGVLQQYHYQAQGKIEHLTDDVQEELFTLMAHMLEVLAPPGTQFQKRAREAIDGPSHLAHRIRLMAGILRSLAAAYPGGYLSSVQELIHADVFDDFLTMADYLLGEGYKDPAAVEASCVLEDHLRKL
jgi:hypothetical protein